MDLFRNAELLCSLSQSSYQSASFLFLEYNNARAPALLVFFTCACEGCITYPVSKDCNRLKYVDFSGSTLLEKTPEFSAASNLEELYLKNCSSLSKIHKSIASLGNLVTLDLSHCSNLRKLPNDLLLKSLKVLNLSYCKKLDKLPNLYVATNLEKLYLKECTSLRMIHTSIGTLNKLVTLDLGKCSNLEKLPSCLTLKSLEHLNLSHCEKLEDIPDFSNALRLKSLYLEKCTNLRMVHESIGSLDELVVLDLRDCYKLVKLPSYLRLKSFELLQLSGCRKLEKFPKVSKIMKSLMFLHLDFTAIKELPLSIRHLTGLFLLNLEGCTNLISLPSTVYLLKSLTELRISGCSKFEATIQGICSSSNVMESSGSLEFPHLLLPRESLSSQLTLLDLQCCNISNAWFLESLSNVAPFLSNILLTGNYFSSLPSCLHKFTSLWNLQLRNCKFLRDIPNLPKSIQTMDATGCESLAISPNNIADIVSSKQDTAFGDFSREFILMNIGIPEWFTYQTLSNSLSVHFRHDLNMEKTLAICALLKIDGGSHRNQEALVSCNILINNRLQSSFVRKFPSSTSEYTWLITTSSTTYSTSLEVNDWNLVNVWFKAVNCSEISVTIRSCGIHLTETQNDVRRSGEIYTDFDQLEELTSLEIVKCFAEEVCSRSDWKYGILHAENYPVGNKIMNFFPIHVTHKHTRIRSMKGMAETTLFKSICNKFEDLSSETLNTDGFLSVGKDIHRWFRSRRKRLPQRYLRIFEDMDRYGDLNEVVDETSDIPPSRIMCVDDFKYLHFSHGHF